MVHKWGWERTLYSVMILMIGLFATPSTLVAQKILQIERTGSLKTKKFYIGNLLTFSLADAPHQFYTREIVDIFPDVGTLQLAGGAVAVKDIAAIRHTGSNRWAKNLGALTLIFSGVWVGYSILDVLINERAPTRFQYIVGGSALGLSGIFSYLIPEKVDRMSNRKRLRLLDLTFYPDHPTPNTNKSGQYP